MASVTAEPAIRPPLRRDRERALLGGVCAGLGRRLGIDPLILRVGFIAAAPAGAAGIVLYAVLWAVLPAAGERGTPAARWRLPAAGKRWQVAAGFGLLTLSLLLLLREWGLWFSDAIVWPVVLTAAGAALIWRQTSPDAPAAEQPPRLEVVRSLRVGRSALGRAALGIALVLGGGLVFLQLNDALQPARDVLLSVLVVLVALTLILAPWWMRLLRRLTEERTERIRSQERAELAAHLHDSVLQTLALMQRRADDPRGIAALARRQERELRAWLNTGRSPEAAADSLAGALEAAAAEVEDAHGVAIDVVAVGDHPLDARAEAVVAATREALVNAAKFAGDGPVSVYAEADEGGVTVFVRDRGPGFDIGAIPADRRGLRESIIGRMERHGGRAIVHSATGAGTEIELTLP
jgi:signal transduction histidine kinase/phage shock protein PspC (stress-responsive transcriptional regulator)